MDNRLMRPRRHSFGWTKAEIEALNYHAINRRRGTWWLKPAILALTRQFGHEFSFSEAKLIAEREYKDRKRRGNNNQSRSDLRNVLEIRTDRLSTRR